MAFNRLTAAKCRIADLLAGAFVARADTTPAAVLTPYGALSRVNLIATIVQADGGTRAVLDDGSGRIAVRAFSPLSMPGVGALVLVIGRPREFGGERYLVPEILRPVAAGWALVHRLELAARAPTDDVPQAAPAPADEARDDPFEGLLAVIRRLDAGGGAPTDQIVAAEGPQTEERLQALLAQGDVFEIRPGFLKVLE